MSTGTKDMPPSKEHLPTLKALRQRERRWIARTTEYDEDGEANIAAFDAAIAVLGNEPTSNETGEKDMSRRSSN